MLRIEGFYTSTYRRVSVNNNNNSGSNKGQVAEATTSSKEAGARKHRSFNDAMNLLLETPGYIKAMGELVSTQLVLKAAPKMVVVNENQKAFNAKVSLIYNGYIEQIIRTHLLDAAYGCWRWNKNEVASLLNGYKSQALRDTNEAKGAEKVALYKVANFCEKKWVVEKLTESLNGIIEDVFAMEDLCIEGFEAILASKYSKLF